MKQLLFALLILPIGLNAQEPAKGTTKIIVKNVTYNDAVQALIASGYMIDKSDKDLQLITTQAMETKRMPCTYKLQIVIQKDSSAIITGVFKINTKFMGVEDDFKPITRRGANRSAYGESFYLMDVYAKSLHGISIEYKQ